MRPIRTLFISHDGGLAGAQRVLLATVCGLEPTLVDAHLVVPHAGELEVLASASGIDVTRRAIRPWAPCLATLDGAGRLRALATFANGIRERVWALAALIERYDIDVVYTNTAIVLEGAIAAWRTCRPHVWHVHEPVFDNPEILPLLPRWLYSSVIDRFSDRVIMPSNSLLRSYTSLSKKTSVVFNGIHIPTSVDRGAASCNLRRQLGLHEHAILIGTVGAIQPRKGYSTLIAAARELHARSPDVRFVVVGKGSDECVRRFEAEIGMADLTGVLIRIPIWDGEIADFFAGVDVAAISSIQESFGLTAAEAMAVGTPVVTTRCGGVEEVIGPSGQEFLVDVGDAAGLARMIGDLCGNPSLRQRVGAIGRDRVMSLFSQQAYLRGVGAVIRDVADANRNRCADTHAIAP